MDKIYIVDTNVLVHDYTSIDKLSNGNTVVIPYTVLEELDGLKIKQGEVGANARKAIRSLEAHIIDNTIIVEHCDTNININDDKILDVAIRYSKQTCTNSTKVILVTKDVCLRTKARASNVLVEDYKDDQVDSSDLYTGFYRDIIKVPASIINKLYSDGFLESDLYFSSNQCVIFEDIANSKNRAITTYKNNRLVLIDNNITACDLDYVNLEQRVLLNHLFDDSIDLVTITGLAGSGKTLMAIAAGLDLMEKGKFKKIVIARPIMPFQKDIGFLPGDIDEKIMPWFAPIMDNLEFLFNYDEQSDEKKAGMKNPLEELITLGVIEMCPLTYIRGRSMPDQYIIVDEAQQTTSNEIKTILTRAGENTKVVLTGDYSQIDNPYLTADTNGLVYCVDRFKDEELAAHVTLTECKRSRLADISSRVL